MKQEPTVVEAMGSGWLSLGAAGVHPLFTPETIREAFARVERGDFIHTSLVGAHTAVRALSETDDMVERGAILRALPTEVLHMVVFLYFRSVDQYVAARETVLH